MPEFLRLLSPDVAFHKLAALTQPVLEGEVVATGLAFQRVTAEAITAPHALPSFPRSTVDGYAVRSVDTFGASDSLPAYLTLAGEVPMGSRPSFTIQPGCCGTIHTGGMLPEGTNAVVMLEHSQRVGESEIEVQRPVAAGENVIEAGEDVVEGQIVIETGVRLRPAVIGGLMAFGITSLAVRRRPRVGLISSGDEVVAPQTQPGPGQVRDVNASALSALVEETGGEPVFYGITPDREDFLYEMARKAHTECDLVVISAGSSASTRDLTAQVIDRLGPPGVLVHGVNIKPGKPTILGVCEGKPVIGLPGNPVSALVIAWRFIVPLLGILVGERRPAFRPSVRARLTLNLASQAGREDWMPARIIKDGPELLAEPIFGKSNLIFTLARADGLVRIPPDATGLVAGEWVDVYLL